jgi:hypothetical protein
MNNYSDELDMEKCFQILEENDFDISIDKIPRLTEIRIWDWPHVVSRYRPEKKEPITHSVIRAMEKIQSIQNILNEYRKTPP